MTAPRKVKAAREIFNAAIEYYEPDQWEAYLVDACGEDETLRQRVRELLDAHRRSDSFLDANAEQTSDLVISERPGTQIGTYKLLQEIGEGGFGVVYMAEQLEPVRRKVALKIIKPGMDTKQVIARFEAERQALAMMDHPNIAKVLDAGATDSGRPYFVMELVKGLPITEFCDTNKLSTRSRLELFVTVCRAVQHAHQKGVIHRDLKPTNVMVTLHDNKPMPVIIDFGVSKAISHQLTEKTLFTAYGQMVGTPAYMSPEQAQMSRMDIDTRSDIYSLGVMLYELLTGSTPLDAEQLRGTAYAEMQRLIREQEALKPSTRLSTLGNALATIAQNRSTDPKKLGQFLRGDLDWITLKALEKERSRRYETANSLANDIERFLNDEAIEACPPSLTYQFRKFVGRHRGLATAGVAIAAAVLLGIIGTTFGMVQAKFDAARARTAFAEADRERQRASDLAGEKQREAQRAEKLRLDTEVLAARQLATRAGMERERGDITLAALLDAEALRRDHADPERAANHRRRLAADLRQSPRPTHLFFHDSTVLDARFSYDGKWIVSACEDGQVQIRDALTGSVERTLKHQGAVRQATFRHDDSRLLTLEATPNPATGAAPFRSYLWDWKRGGKPLVDLPEGGNWRFSGSQIGNSQSFPNVSPDKQLQLRSDVDGQPLGPSLDYPQNDYLSHNGFDHVAIIARETAESEPPVESPGPGGRFQFGQGQSPFTGRQPVSNYRWELWNGKTGQLTTLFEWRAAPVFLQSANRTLCFSSDRSLVAIQAGPRATLICNVASGEQIQRLEYGTVAENRNRIASVAQPVQFSPDNKTLMCLDDYELVLLDVASSRLVGRRIAVRTTSANCRFSPDGSRILSINRQGDPQVWHTATGEAASPPLESSAEVQEVAFSPDGRYVKVACVDGTIRVWDSLSGAPATPLMKHVGAIATSSFSRDGSRLMVAAGRNVWLWPIGWPEFEQVTIPLPRPQGTPAPFAGLMSRLSLAQISPDGQRIVTVGFSSEPSESNGFAPFRQTEMCVWDSTKGQKLFGPVQLDLARTSILAGVISIFSNDGRRILVVERGPRTESRGRVWDLDSGDPVEVDVPEGYRLAQAMFSTDGRRVMAMLLASDPQSQSFESKVQVYDSETGEACGPIIKGFSGLSPAGALEGCSPRGNRVAIVDDESDGRSVVILDTTTGQPVGPPLEHQNPVIQYEFCDAGRGLMTLARRNDGVDLTIWTTENCSQKFGPVTIPESGDTSAVRCSVNSSLTCAAIHTTSGPVMPDRFSLSPTVTIHHFDSGKRFELPHDQGVTGAVFDAAGQLLLTTGLDNVARIWDTMSGQLVRPIRLQANHGQLVDAQFSSDGARIVTKTTTGFRVWEVATGQPLSAFLQQIGPGSQFGQNPVANRLEESFARAFRNQTGLWSSAIDRLLLRDGARITVYDLSAEERSIDELQRMTRVLSGRRVNPLGNVETVRQEQLQREWEPAQALLGDRLIPAPTGVDWHRLQAQKTDDPFAEIWHLGHLLQADPSDGPGFLRRGQLLAAQGRHEEAAADFNLALKNGANDVLLERVNSLAQLKRWGEAAHDLQVAVDIIVLQDELRQNLRGSGFPAGPANLQRWETYEALAIACLLAGDRSGYEQACQNLLNAPTFGTPLTFLGVPLLVPREREYCDSIAERFERLFGPRVRLRLAPIAALLAFRRGRPDQAVELLVENFENNETVDLLVLAMAFWQCEQSDEAIRLLDLAAKQIAEQESYGDEGRTPTGQLRSNQPWVDAAIAEILYREAEQMIRGKGSVSSPQAASDQ